MSQSNARSIPAVWVHTTAGAFNKLARSYAAFLTADQQAQVERVRQARMIFEGQHEEYFVDEGRTRFPVPKIRTDDGIVRLYVPINLSGLVCRKTADLLFGVPPKIDDDGGDVPEQKLAALRDRSSLDRLFYNACLECTYEAEGFLEAIVHEGEAYVQSIPADEIFRVGERAPDGQYRRYVRYRLKDVGTPQAPIWLLLETWYLKGSIEQKLWQLENGQRKKEVDLAYWPIEDGDAPLSPVVKTGLDRNTVTWVYNELCRGRPVSLVDRTIRLQDSVNASESQIKSVVMKHANPKLAVPESAVDESTGGIRGDHEVFFYRSKEEMPAYIVWQAQLEAAEKSKDQDIQLFCILSETSPSLLGLKQGAAPDAARKLRLEATNTLAMVQRVGANWTPAIKRAISVAQDLEQTIPGTRYDRGQVSVKMMDGLPIDTLDQANELSILKSTGLLSVERGVGILVEDKAEADAEVARIAAAEAKAAALATPPILMGTGAGGEEAGTAGGAAVVGGEQQSDAVASNDLRQTVGGSVAVRDLQKAYYNGELPRAAALANLTTVFGFSPSEAERFLPEKKPDAPGAAAAAKKAGASPAARTEPRPPFSAGVAR